MYRAFPTILLTAVSVFSAVPHTFSSGKPAVAQDVNENFVYLDTTVAKKADQTAVTTLQTTVSGLQTSKADASDLTKLSNKELADVAALNATLKGSLTSDGLKGIRDTLGKKADASITDSLGKRITAINPISIGAIPASNASNFLSTTGGTITGPIDINHNLTIGGGGVVNISNAGGIYTSFVQVRDTLNLAKLAGNGSRLVVTDARGTLQSGIDVSSVTTGGPYLKTSSDTTQSLSGNINWTASSGSNFPGHYYTNLYSNEGSNGQVYVHYYPAEMAGSSGEKTSASLRVKNGNASMGHGEDVNVLVIGGDGHLSWVVGTQSQTIAHSGNIQEMGVVMSTGGAINGNLHVAGSLTTNPNLPVADYVFEPGYKLTALSEVEAYTKEHKHLPEVPSATEIEKGGLDLAQMNLVLLKKVEELTLHAIEQQKEITELRASVEELKKR